MSKFARQNIKYRPTINFRAGPGEGFAYTMSDAVVNWWSLENPTIEATAAGTYRSQDHENAKALSPLIYPANNQRAGVSTDVPSKKIAQNSVRFSEATPAQVASTNTNVASFANPEIPKGDNPFAISFWIKAHTGVPQCTPIAQSSQFVSTTRPEYLVVTDTGGRIQLILYSQQDLGTSISIRINSLEAFSTSAWNHVIFSYSGTIFNAAGNVMLSNGLEAYFNGVKLNTGLGGNGLSLRNNSYQGMLTSIENRFNIGDSFGTTTALLSDVIVFDRAIDEHSAAALYYAKDGVFKRTRNFARKGSTITPTEGTEVDPFREGVSIRNGEDLATSIRMKIHSSLDFVRSHSGSAVTVDAPFDDSNIPSYLGINLAKAASFTKKITGVSGLSTGQVLTLFSLSVDGKTVVTTAFAVDTTVNTQDGSKDATGRIIIGTSGVGTVVNANVDLAQKLVAVINAANINIEASTASATSDTITLTQIKKGAAGNTSNFTNIPGLKEPSRLFEVFTLTGGLDGAATKFLGVLDSSRGKSGYSSLLLHEVEKRDFGTLNRHQDGTPFNDTLFDSPQKILEDPRNFLFRRRATARLTVADGNLVCDDAGSPISELDHVELIAENGVKKRYVFIDDNATAVATGKVLAAGDDIGSRVLAANVSASSLVNGREYRILSTGKTQNWKALGASSDRPAAGEVFIAAANANGNAEPRQVAGSNSGFPDHGTVEEAAIGGVAYAANLTGGSKATQYVVLTKLKDAINHANGHNAGVANSVVEISLPASEADGLQTMTLVTDENSSHKITSNIPFLSLEGFTASVAADDRHLRVYIAETPDELYNASDVYDKEARVDIFDRNLSLKGSLSDVRDAERDSAKRPRRLTSSGSMTTPSRFRGFSGECNCIQITDIRYNDLREAAVPFYEVYRDGDMHFTSSATKDTFFHDGRGTIETVLSQSSGARHIGTSYNMGSNEPYGVYAQSTVDTFYGLNGADKLQGNSFTARYRVSSADRPFHDTAKENFVEEKFNSLNFDFDAGVGASAQLVYGTGANFNNNNAVTITSADQTTKKYRITSAGGITTGEMLGAFVAVAMGANNSATAAQIVAAINSANGHNAGTPNSKIILETDPINEVEGTITFTQAVGGTAGNTTTTKIGDFTVTNFSGGKQSDNKDFVDTMRKLYMTGSSIHKGSQTGYNLSTRGIQGDLGLYKNDSIAFVGMKRD